GSSGSDVGALISESGQLLAEEQVERVGDLESLFVTGDGHDIAAEPFDQSRVIGRCGCLRPVLFVSATEGVGAKTLRGLHAPPLGPIARPAQDLSLTCRSPGRSCAFSPCSLNPDAPSPDSSLLMPSLRLRRPDGV